MGDGAALERWVYRLRFGGFLRGFLRRSLLTDNLLRIKNPYSVMQM